MRNAIHCHFALPRHSFFISVSHRIFVLDLVTEVLHWAALWAWLNWPALDDPVDSGWVFPLGFSLIVQLSLHFYEYTLKFIEKKNNDEDENADGGQDGKDDDETKHHEDELSARGRRVYAMVEISEKRVIVLATLVGATFNIKRDNEL